jgi:protein TonB
VIYAFATGLAKSGQRYLSTILQTTMIQQEKPKDLPPPPPAPRAVVPGTPIKPISMPDVHDYYPEQARRDGQEGRAQVKVCVGANGKIESAETASTSGFPALDEAAVKVAKAARFKPATSEGKPIESCATLPVKFELHGS